MNDQAVSTDSKNMKKTYRRIRRAIGYLGISLPFVLVLFSILTIFETEVQKSISAFYYTNLREVFTGTLCATGLFLIRYVGYKDSCFWKNDDLLTNIAGYMAIGVAFFPTNPASWSDKIYTLLPYKVEFLGYFHYGFAIIFFLLLAIISLMAFTNGQTADEKAGKSIFNENNIYRLCGILILLFLLCTLVFMILDIFKYSTLLFEALMLLSFGISWLIKGRALGDKGKIGEKLYSEFN